MQKKHRNLKVTSYYTVSEWVVDWANNVSSETLVKAFICCGITSAYGFDIRKLHSPLKSFSMTISTLILGQQRLQTTFLRVRIAILI